MSTLEARILRIKAQTPTGATKPLDSPTRWHYLSEFRELLPDGEEYMVLHLFAVTDWTCVPHNRAPEEHSEISWFAVEDACRLALAHPAYPVLLRRVASVTSSTERGVQA